MSHRQNVSLTITRQFPFSAERVFDAWLDPDFATRWLFATWSGKNMRGAIDPKAGGKFTFTENRDGEDVEHTGEYLEIDRPRKLVFTFGVPKYSPEFDRVTVDIAPSESGCVLTLTHEMKPEVAEWKDATQSGWTMIVQNLAAELGDPIATINAAPAQAVARGEIRIVRTLPGPIERVWDYLVDGTKRSKWFAGGTIEPVVGGKADFRFCHSEIAPGETPPPEYKHVHDAPGVAMPCVVTRYEPPRALGFTWGGDDRGNCSEVLFELEPENDRVHLALTHRNLPNRKETTNVGAGWHLHLSVLDSLLSETPQIPFWATHSQLESQYAKILP